MVDKISEVKNWHYYVYGALAALGLTLAAMLTGAVATPAPLVPLVPWLTLVSLFLSFFLPRIQTQTGAGAPPLLSPPAKGKQDS